MPPDLLDRCFPLLFGLALLSTGASVGASILYRLSRGKPILSGRIPDAVFFESAASGYSNRTWYTKLGRANRCLIVAVTGTHLIIRPRFPFNLMFLPEVYGLEHEVSIERVTRAEMELDRGWSTAVRLEFRDPDETPQDVTLYLRNPAEFLNALSKPGARAGERTRTANSDQRTTNSEPRTANRSTASFVPKGADWILVGRA